MKELNRTTRLIIAAVFAILVIAVGYLTMHRPALVYRQTTVEIVAKASDTSCLVSPVTLKAALELKDNKTVLIDVRNTDEYSKGHIGNAINIPVRDLLENRSLKKIKEISKARAMVVLYGKDQLQASSPCMILQQLGIDNVKVLEGGYSYYKNPPADSLFKGQAAGFVSEVSRIDAAFLQKSVPVQSQTSKSVSGDKKAETVKSVKKPGGSGGGC